MPTLLLEIGCEELPAGACREAGEQLPVIAERELGLAPDNVFVGPRRLALLFEDVPERTPDEWIITPIRLFISCDQFAQSFTRTIIHPVLWELLSYFAFDGSEIDSRDLARLSSSRVRGLPMSMPMIPAKVEIEMRQVS